MGREGGGRGGHLGSRHGSHVALHGRVERGEMGGLPQGPLLSQWRDRRAVASAAGDQARVEAGAAAPLGDRSGPRGVEARPCNQPTSLITSCQLCVACLGTPA